MEPFIGQIQAFGFNFVPENWESCDGQLLAISQNTALFSLLGTTYGGDGRTTFGLPDLRGRSIVHRGSGPGLSTITQGQRGGVEQAFITTLNLPAHSHTLTNGVANVEVFTTNNGNDSSETDGGSNGLGTTGNMPEIYREGPTQLDKLGGVKISGNTDLVGGNQPLQTRSPFLGVCVCIALLGIFPTRK